MNSTPHSPICLHPQNPHYFLFRDKPTVLITSAEHYGAVVNLDFDYVPYLDCLAAHRLNYTRIYPGALFEREGDFIAENILAPRKGRLILPWARSSTPRRCGWWGQVRPRPVGSGLLCPAARLCRPGRAARGRGRDLLL